MSISRTCDVLWSNNGRTKLSFANTSLLYEGAEDMLTELHLTYVSCTHYSL